MKPTPAHPICEPFDQGRLKVSDLHELHYEQVGHPQGVPVLFVHGGPGGGISPQCRQFFDPEFYRVILFDQRGAGLSTPQAELEENSTWDLVSDMEKLREHLGLESWILFGGSWGSTLSLIYAETYPERVRALALRGIFLCRPQELQWFYQEGAHRLFPDAWEKYLEPIPHAERGNLMEAYYKRLTSSDKEIRLQSARAWSQWEAATSKLLPDPQLVDHHGESEFALAFARIECHYFVNGIFVDSDNYILEQAHKIQHIPCQIVHGRYDVVCPIENAWDLKKALPQAKLHIVADAGHSAFEPSIQAQLVQVMEEFKKL